MGKGLFIQRVNKLFLLEFDLIGLVDFAGCELDGLHDQRHNELLGGVLLLVVNTGLYMGALVDLVGLETAVGVQFVRGHRPKVEQQQHSITPHC